MKKLFSRLPKKLLAVAVTVAVLAGVGAVAYAGFGPDRPTKVYNGPGTPGFTYPVFNSFTNVPGIGDERAFFTGAYPGGGALTDPLAQVKDGDELTLQVYVHNNADPSLNASGAGIARDTRVAISLPNKLAASQEASAAITADNTQPKKVTDTLDFSNEQGQAFQLTYEKGSAHIRGNYINKALSDDVVSAKGALVGTLAADGNVKGCFQQEVLVTIKVKVSVPKFTVKKQVRLDGQTTADWKSEITALPGQTLNYKIEFLNTGATMLNNVVVRDQLPAHVHLVPGSTMLYNALAPNGISAGSDSVISAGGIDVGSYSPGSNGIVYFKATVDPIDKLDCGANKLVNTGFMRPGDQNTVWYPATATVDVNGKACVTPQTPVCSALTVDQTDRTVKATVTYSPNGHTFKNVSVDFGDKTAPALSNQASNNSVVISHTYGADVTGATVKAAVVFDDNATVTSDACVKTVSFTNPTTPTTLVNTGSGDVIGLFLGVSAIGAVAYNLVARRRAFDL